MKSPYALLAFTLAVAGACSSNPTHPPITTASPGTPSQPGGSTPAQDDAGTENDSGSSTTPVPDGGQLCAAGGCNGCCNALGYCQPGTSNSACGVSAVVCVQCTLGQNCTNGFCQ